MRSEIRNIRMVAKDGAYGDSTKTGFWIYGRRPDGRTVPCKCRTLPDGRVVVFSTWKSPTCKTGEVEECVSEFTPEEWRYVVTQPDEEAIYRSNRVLDSRRKTTARPSKR